MPYAPFSAVLRRALPTALLAGAFLSGLLTAGPSQAARAAEPWNGPAFSASPAELVRAAAALEDDEAQGVDVLLLETVYSYDAEGRETYTQRMVYRFVDDSAHESWSTVEQPWSPWHQEKPRFRARVVTPDGGEHRLDPATVTENAESQGSPDMFEDGRVLRAPLPATGRGSVVEQEVTVAESLPFFEGGSVEHAHVQMAVPVRRARLVLDAPVGLPLRWTIRLLPGVAPSEEVSAGRRRLTFEMTDVQPYEEPETGLPPEVQRAAYVAFSTGQSWGDLARRYSDIVDRTARGADLSAFVQSALRTAGPQSSQVDTINALLRKLGREIRYTGIELGEGGIVPRTPAETLKRKFGDCKDKAVLLTALLRSLDIPAYVALLNAGEDEPDVEEALPGMGAFNHAIVMVPGNPAVWIDPTEPYARAGELPIQDQGRLALVASPTATGLVRTPESTSADNREVETREIYLSDLGGARVVETTEYWGSQDQELRSSYADADPKEMRDGLADYVSETYLADKLTDFDYSDPEDLSRPFRLHLEAAGAGRGTTDVREAAVGIFFSSFTDRLPDAVTGADTDEGDEGDDEDDDEDDDEGDEGEAAAPAKRVNDYVFSRPLQLEVRYRIVPPAGFVARPLPAWRSRQFGSAKLEEAYQSNQDGVVTATLRFDTGKRRISPSEFEAMRTGLTGLGEEKPLLISFDQVGESHLTAGRIREALDEFRRLSSAAPKKALPHTRIARALLAGGLGDAAREEAERATRVEPDLAYAWVLLAWMRQHDDLGRRFGEGYDRAGSIAAYRKALELAPDNTEARGDLAILLEHDAQGDRYTAGADLTAAIEAYLPLKDGLDGLGLANNLVIAYMWAQRFDEMKALLDGMDSANGRGALKLVALAATSGTGGGADAALRDAERNFPDATARAEALSGAARNLMLLRRYPEAAALFDASGRQSANAAAVLGLAEVLRKTRRFEELTWSSKDPAGTLQRLISLAATGDSSPERYAPLLSREMTRGLTPAESKEFWDGFKSGFSETTKAARSAEMPLAVAMDIGLAMARPTVSGDDAVGYRVVLTTSAGTRTRTVAFVVPEDGEYRIAATEKSMALVGREALRRLGQDDLKGARQWLDWAYEEMAEDGRKITDSAAVPPFLTLWSGSAGSLGKEPVAEPDEARIRCAAASLMAWEQMSKESLPLLKACRDAEGDAARQTALDLALLADYQALQQDREAIAMVQRLETANPDSAFLYMNQAVSLRRLELWDDMARLAEARLKRTSDTTAQLILVEMALRKGDFDAAEARLQTAIDSGKAGPEVYNQLSWIKLFRGKADDQTVELAQRAASLSDYKVYSVLHTLATLYAEQGKTAEAYRLVLQALTAKGAGPGVNDWYVFGRLAEHYGMPDAARHYYEKASEGEGADQNGPADTIHLVRKRLEALGSPSATPAKAKTAKTAARASSR